MAERWHGVGGHVDLECAAESFAAYGPSLADPKAAEVAANMARARLAAKDPARGTA